MESLFYVYVYLDPRHVYNHYYDDIFFDFKPFYVGKGKEGSNRCYKHLEWVEKKKKDITNNNLKMNIINNILKEGLRPIIRKVRFFENEEEAYSFETDLINQLGFRYNNSGILSNISFGGFGGDTFTNNPNKEKIREMKRIQMTGSNNHKFGIKKEDTPSNKMKGESHWNFGRKASEETREKMRKYNKGSNNGNSKKILQFDLDGNFLKEWECIKYASIENFTKSSSIISVCKGKRFSAAGFIWRYKIDDSTEIQFSYNRQVIDGKRTANYEKTNEIPCIKLSLDGEIIEEFDSIFKANESIGLGTVGLCCRGKIHSAGGFDWVYKDDDLRKNYQKSKEDKKKEIIDNLKNKSKEIIQYKKSGEIIKIWKSISEASRVLNISKASIAMCCKGERYKSVGGFVWKYK